MHDRVSVHERARLYAQVTLRIVKTSNATYGHHGEMAHGQFYYAS